MPEATSAVKSAATARGSAGPVFLNTRAGAGAAGPDDLILRAASAAKLDYAGILTFRGWIDIAERFGMGSRTFVRRFYV